MASYSSDEFCELFCGECDAKGETSRASVFCPECENDLFCVKCEKGHKAHRRTGKHQTKHVSSYSNLSKESPSRPVNKSMTEVDKNRKFKPGPPTLTEVNFDFVTLQWDTPEAFQDGDYFQISYREQKQTEWETYREKCIYSIQTVTNLKPETNYFFRVRVIHNDWEGPYSDESVCLTTLKSAASALVKMPSCIYIADTLPRQYALNMRQTSRTESAKIRAYELGSKQILSFAEKTIMMVGETGTGKSTLIDAMANYILGVRWEDTFRLKMVSLEREEKNNSKQKDQSQTEWVTRYTIHPHRNARLKYSINIIDTPGFGDTRGIENDKKIVEQINKFFKSPPPDGILSIDCFCFLVKASESRLTQSQRYIFSSIMSIFGKDIEGNICTMITFTDDDEPEVLDTLISSKMPFGQHFMFNNKALFKQINNNSRTQWEMGIGSFQTFFSFIESLETKSLQLSKDVLSERSRLETNMSNLEITIDDALCKVQELRSEIDALEKYKEIIESNQNFTFHVIETVKRKQPLQSTQYVTNCTYCEYTCHPKCKRSKNSDKKGCWAMGKDGQCRICPKNCFWKAHINEPYQFVFVNETVEKTYDEMKKKLEKATGEALNQKQVLEMKKKEFISLNTRMEDMMNTVISCKKRLDEIALLPNPLSNEEYINQLIAYEQKKQKPGFIDRIKMYEGLKKKPYVPERYQTFRRETAANVLTALKDKTEKQPWYKFIFQN